MTVPIITSTNATVPGTTSSCGSPASGGRTPTTPSRRSNGAMRENRSKYTANASPRRVHVSTPKTAWPRA